MFEPQLLVQIDGGFIVSECNAHQYMDLKRGAERDQARQQHSAMAVSLMISRNVKTHLGSISKCGLQTVGLKAYPGNDHLPLFKDPKRPRRGIVFLEPRDAALYRD